MRRRALTLPELDERLDGLLEGGVHQITRPEYERLFGANDVALGRLRKFCGRRSGLVPAFGLISA
jgi:hypothetical protein